MSRLNTKIKNWFAKVKQKSFHPHKGDYELDSPHEVKTEELEASKVAYLTDVQGNLEYFKRYVDMSEVLYFRKQKKCEKLELHDNTIFVYGGNLFDNGPGDIRLAKMLIRLKKRYRDRVYLLMGPRDACKLRFTAELSEQELQRPLESAPGIGQVICKKPLNHAKEEGQAGKSLRCCRLKWMLEETMDAKKAFEFRRSELSLLSGKDKISDEEVVESFLDSVHPTSGFVIEYLKLCQVAVVIDETLYIHGGAIDGSFRFIPNPHGLRYFDSHTGEVLNKPDDGLPGRQLPPSSKIQEWVDDINKFSRVALEDYKKHPAWYKDYKWRGGEALIAYFSTLDSLDRGMTSHSFMHYGGFRIDFALEKRLMQSSLRRIICGQQSIGDIPIILKRLETEIIISNISNSDMNASNERDKGVAEVLILENGNTYLHGVSKDGVAYHFEVDRCHEKFIGRKTPDGYYVNALLENGKYAVTKVEKDNVLTEYRSKDELFDGKLSIPVAATVWKNVKNKADEEYAFIRSALASFCENGEENLDFSSRLGNENSSEPKNVNVGVAKLIGCMLLEANDYEFTAKLQQKLGGRSPLTATCLKGKSANRQLKELEETNLISVMVHTPDFLKPSTGWK